MSDQLTMRDTFAAAALNGWLASQQTVINQHTMARKAYEYADAMLRERDNHIADADKMVETPGDEWVDFNANDYVRVKLTQHGRDLLKKQHEALNAVSVYLPYRPPTEDSDGWSRWQLHRLMNHFGSHTGMGMPLCFETCIQFEVIKAPYGAANACETVPITEGDALGTIKNGEPRRPMPKGPPPALQPKSNHDAAPAATASVESVGTDKAEPLHGLGTGDPQEPVAWAVEWEKDGVDETDWENIFGTKREANGYAKAFYPHRATVVPLYRSPQPALTDAERKAMEVAIRDAEQESELFEYEEGFARAATLRGILERLGGGR